MSTGLISLLFSSAICHQLYDQILFCWFGSGQLWHHYKPMNGWEELGHQAMCLYLIQNSWGRLYHLVHMIPVLSPHPTHLIQTGQRGHNSHCHQMLTQHWIKKATKDRVKSLKNRLLYLIGVLHNSQEYFTNTITKHYEKYTLVFHVENDTLNLSS